MSIVSKTQIRLISKIIKIDELSILHDIENNIDNLEKEDNSI